MALATRCPACSTVFRISTAQAAAKGGMVRCGACRNVFNSLDALVRVEDLDVVEEVTIQPAEVRPLVGDALPPGSQPVAPPPAIDDDEPEVEPHDGTVEPAPVAEPGAVVTEWWMPDGPAASRPADPATSAAASAGTSAAASPGPHGISPDATPAPSTPTDAASIPSDLDAGTAGGSTMGGPTTGRSVTGWTLSALAAATTGARGASTQGTGTYATGVDAAGVQPGSAIDDEPPPVDIAGTNPVFMRPEPMYEPAPRGMRLVFALLCLLAALALAAQLAYQWRDELAVRWAPARPWLAAACRTFGCTVGQPVHAESITIESAAVQTLAPNGNTYVLTALLRNRDTIDLRYPTLELVLTDLQDQPILRRDLRPEDYLAGVVGHPVGAGFPAQSELPIRLTFELTGLRFSGYRLNQLYP